MKVQEVMSRDPWTCAPSQTLDCAARAMWDRDCGVVPVVDPSTGRVVGVVTDRDICIAAYTKNVAISRIPIRSIAMKPVVSIGPQDSIQAAEDAMRKHRVRRLVVVDDGGCLVGMLSLNDIVRVASSKSRDVPSDAIATTLAAIGEPHVRPTVGGTA
jgi:CBS domain-containing protein